MSSLKNVLNSLDAFEPEPDLTEEQRKHETRLNRLATRVLLIVLIIGLIVLGIFFRMRGRNTLSALEHPTLDRFMQLSSDAHCPCTETSVFFGDFVSMETRFHQVCSSDFISERWIRAINTGSNMTYFYHEDFRTDGSASFQALAGLCRLSEAYVLQSIQSLTYDLLITREVLREKIFQEQIDVALQSFLESVSDEFLLQLQSLRTMIIHSQVYSGLQTNVFQQYFFTDAVPPIVGTYPKLHPTNDSSCDCLLNVSCSVTSRIFDIYKPREQDILPDNVTILMEIPGFRHSCFPVNSILVSTLECFYDQKCIDKLLSFFPTMQNFSALNLSVKTRFKSTNQIKEIINALMVEEWIMNVSYEKYYKKCAPMSCTFFQNLKEDGTSVLKKLVSLLGGLVMVIGFVAQSLVKFIERDRSRRITKPSIPLKTKLKQILNKSIFELNLLKRLGSDDRQTKYQRIATRIYIGVLVLSLIVLSFSTLIHESIHRKTIVIPTQRQYDQLYSIHGDNLYCACSSSSTAYGTFLTIEAVFHQICSSDFISQSWIDYIDEIYANSDMTFSPYDFRSSASFQFQLLIILCHEAQQKVNSSLETYRQKKFLSSQMISRMVFESKFTMSIESWQAQTLKRFLRTIQLFRALIRGNQLLSDISSMFITHNDQNETVLALQIPHNENCSCALSSSCVQAMGIYDVYQSNLGILDLQFELPNFFLSCFPIEALLQSTLECFYNLSCLLEIDRYYSNYTLQQAFDFQPLNSSYNSPYETIESIVNKLMIKSWSWNISFDSYYQSCAPSTCTYEYLARNDLFTSLTIILGIFGGLSLGLKLLILSILRITENLIYINHSRHNYRIYIQKLFALDTERRKIDRLHFIVLIVVLSLVFAFNTVVSQLFTIEITEPLFSTYQDLSKYHSDSLQCFCSQVSIPYRSFLTIVPHFHSLCSSHFISDDWIVHLYHQYETLPQPIRPSYQSSATGQFALLASLCQFCQEETNVTLSQLLINDITTSQLLSENLFIEKIQRIIDQQRAIMTESLLNLLDLMREMIGANMIMSTWSTNWAYVPDNEMLLYSTAHTIPIVYDDCHCGISWQCTMPSQGMMTGCYPLEALLQSTLECFYNQTCIDPSETFPSLNRSNLNESIYKLNTTIQSILNNLMIEKYTIQWSYEKYFKQCSPSSCKYSYMKSADAIESIIDLVSLYGGVLLLTRSFAVILIKWIYEKRKIRVYPANFQQNTV